MYSLNIVCVRQFFKSSAATCKPLGSGKEKAKRNESIPCEQIQLCIVQTAASESQKVRITRPRRGCNDTIYSSEKPRELTPAFCSKKRTTCFSSPCNLCL